MAGFTLQEVTLLLMEILDRQEHIKHSQEKLEKTFAALQGKVQENISTELGAFLSVFLRQQKYIQVVQRRMEHLFEVAGKKQKW